MIFSFPLKGLGAYCVSKTALFGLTRALAIECADMGVRVNCVAPGIIKTRFSAAVSLSLFYINCLLPNVFSQSETSILKVVFDSDG